MKEIFSAFLMLSNVKMGQMWPEQYVKVKYVYFFLNKSIKKHTDTDLIPIFCQLWSPQFINTLLLKKQTNYIL